LGELGVKRHLKVKVSAGDVLSNVATRMIGEGRDVPLTV